MRGRTKVTETAQNADFAENRRFSQFRLSWKFKGAGKPQIFAENRRKFADSLQGLFSRTLKSSDILFPYRSPSPRPHPDSTLTPPRPHPTPRNGPETDPKQTRNGARRSQTDPNRAKRSRNGPKSSLLGGTAGGVSWDLGGGL